VYGQFVKEIDVDSQVLEECMEETLKMVEAAQKPIIIADMELIRKKLHKQFRHLLEKSGFPYGNSPTPDPAAVLARAC
jgi:indolepyruvate decarboxylase